MISSRNIVIVTFIFKKLIKYHVKPFQHAPKMLTGPIMLSSHLVAVVSCHHPHNYVSGGENCIYLQVRMCILATLSSPEKQPYRLSVQATYYNCRSYDGSKRNAKGVTLVLSH